jgi:tetratricopeptide (TPR) repeat protein
MGQAREASADLLVAALVTAAVSIALVPLVQRDLGWVDSVEFALAGSTLGIPHPTGYPLYTLTGRLAALTAGAAGVEPAFGVNLISALCGAVAVGLAVLLARRMGLGLLPAVAAALLLAGSREFLLAATTAEVYTFHLVLLELLLLAALAAERNARALLLAVFFLGLGLAHHLTIVLAVPAVLVLVRPAALLALGGRGRGAWCVALGSALAFGLTLYAVLLLRSAADPRLDQGDPETLRRLVEHVSGRQFSYRLLTSETAYVEAEVVRCGGLLAAQWSPVALPWIPLGAVVLLRRSAFHRRVLLAWGLLALAAAAHAVAYRIPDKDAYYLPVYLVAALLAGAAADWLLAAVRWGRLARAATGGALIALALVPFVAHRAAADRHHDRSLRDLALEVARRTTPGSLILSDDTSLAFALLYLGEAVPEIAERTVVMQYLLPLGWYAAAPALDPDLDREVLARAAARRGLRGRALGERLAADARELAAGLARHALETRDVFVYFHEFAEEKRSFDGLPLVDRGLVYQVARAEMVGRPDVEFARFEAYLPANRRTREEDSVARRFAAAINRAAIARVHAGDAAGAAGEFRRALALDPEYAQAWLNLGLVTADYLGRPDEARAAWRTFLELAGDAKEAPGVRARLSALP